MTIDWPAQTLGAVLARQARERGAVEALVTRGARRSFAALAADAHAVSRSLIAMGIGHGDHVAVMMPNDERWLAFFYGAATIGALTVPVNTRFKGAELAFCLKQSDSVLVALADRFLTADFVGALREAEPAVDRAIPGTALPRLRHAIVAGMDVPQGAITWSEFLERGASIAEAAVDAAAARVKPDDPLLMQFTSGTTAYPKGVVLTHDNMLRNAWAASIRLGVTHADRYFNCRPFFHVAGSTLTALLSLVTGACVVTPPTFEPGEALELLATERCTTISGNDTIFQMLMAHPNFDRSRLHLTKGWAAAGPETMRKIIEEMGIRDLCAAYGLSEASPNVVLNDRNDPIETRIAGRAKPHPGIAVRIADPETNAILGPDEPGEIQVRGWSVMRGYYNNVEANAKVFTADGWLRTGDLGALDVDGRLRMVGRLKDVFRVGGENVAPAEVEEILLSHPAIATAQVIGVPDTRLGEVPAAYITLRPDMMVAEVAILEWMRPRCANFRLPRYLRVVENFDAIGMTASGKVQKTKLREHALVDLGLAPGK